MFWGLFRGMFRGMFRSAGVLTKRTLWGYVSGYVSRYVSGYVSEVSNILVRGCAHAEPTPAGAPPSPQSLRFRVLLNSDRVPVFLFGFLHLSRPGWCKVWAWPCSRPVVFSTTWTCLHQAGARFGLVRPGFKQSRAGGSWMPGKLPRSQQLPAGLGPPSPAGAFACVFALLNGPGLAQFWVWVQWVKGCFMEVVFEWMAWRCCNWIV